jgi:hypothetical protein
MHPDRAQIADDDIDQNSTLTLDNKVAFLSELLTLVVSQI